MYLYSDHQRCFNLSLIMRRSFDQQRDFAYTSVMRKRDDKKYEQIIDSVTELILQVGLSDITIAKIAATAQLYPSTIYIYFDNKEDLLRQVFQRQRQNLQHYLSAKLALAATPTQQVQIYMRALYQFAQDQPRSLATLQQFLNSPLLTQLAIPAVEQNLIFPEFQTVIEQGQAAGDFRVLPSGLAILLINSDVLQYAQAIQQQLVDPVMQPLEQLLNLTATWLTDPK
ncbi:TetR/AcrR family transcriptional regulator [Loigolactobacillus zhaoyuanensis]|uniref:TetR/AcrR family transcriptional regulator n=2 Tax=Loigolactobacillus zhaoyuanensis TaxID=2486017 RepID=A0ABW8UBT4_9LACO